MNARCTLRLLGLAIAAAAVMPVHSLAQQTPRDTSRTSADTVAIPIPSATDSITVPADTAQQTEADTLQPPLARAESPLAIEIGRPYVWTRDALFSSGAATLLELLERVPGLTGFTSAWLVAPEAASYVGAFGRVRVFYDGIELDALNPRMGGALDLSSLELWTLEDVTLERAPGELRVHARSWRVERTTSNTRADVTTGDNRTNIFRGFYGRRFARGEALQLGAQQSSTTEVQRGGDGDQLALFARAGWAGRRWSVDGFLSSASRLRAAQQRFTERAPLAPLDARRSLAYLRAGYGDPTAGAWAQLIASWQRFDERTEPPPSAGGMEFPADTVDTLVSRPQYVATGGYSRGALNVSGTARLRSADGETSISPSARASYAARLVQIAAFAERSTEDSAVRADVALHVTPVSFVSLAGGVSQTSPFGDDLRESAQALRAELGVRLRPALWLSGGLLSRTSDAVRPPSVFDPGWVDGTRATSGVFVRLRGPVWRDISTNVVATQWDEDAVSFGYLPERQITAELTLDTRWLTRFPDGNFGLRTSLTAEHRGEVAFPVVEGGFAIAPSSTVMGGVLEIRIFDAILSLQARNLTGIQYAIVPGFLMPGPVLVYGVRWQFWN